MIFFKSYDIVNSYHKPGGSGYEYSSSISFA